VVKMAVSVSGCYMQSDLNVCNQDVNDPLTCFNCTELRNSLHSALTELSSLQVINKLLFKELEMACGYVRCSEQFKDGRIL
jgi:hypothetical protein